MAGEGPEDERELLEERRARVRALAAQCKPSCELALGESLLGVLHLDPRRLYQLFVEAEALAEAYP